MDNKQRPRTMNQSRFKGKNKSKQQGKERQRKRELAPVAAGVITVAQKPKFTNRGQNVRVAHREYITDVSGVTTAFLSELSLRINPGNASCFPWLSAIARRFESYCFRKLQFCYETETATSTTGYVLLTIDYDPRDPAPLSKIVAFNYEGAIKGAPWQSFKHISSAQNLSKRKTYFVADTGQPDADLYDVGNLYVALGGQAGTAKVGEIWVEYEVDLMTPQLENNSVFQVNSQIINGVSAMTPALPFGTAPTFVTTGSSLVTYNSGNGNFVNVLTFPIQLFVMIEIVGTVITGFTLTTTGTEFTAVSFIVNAGGTIATQAWLIELAEDQIFDFSVTATAVTAAQMYLVPFGVYE